MLAFDSGGLEWVLILTGGRWASALAGRTGRWLSKPRPSPAEPGAWCIHGLAVFWTHPPHVHTDIEHFKIKRREEIVKFTDRHFGQI